jgi:hypothetical protein
MRVDTKVAIFAGYILGAIALPVAGAGCAYADDLVRVRGTIESVDGSTYVVKTRDGAEQKIALAPNAQVAGVVKTSLADVKPDSFVGVTALPQSDGTQRALEIHIFPESMRGTGRRRRHAETRNCKIERGRAAQLLDQPRTCA